MRRPLPALPTAVALAVLPVGAAAQNEGFDPPVAVDLDPRPEVIEVELVAAEGSWEFVPGRSTRVWAYNGSVPGPTIVGEVGDLLRVHFRNELPEPTTIHWHGLEVPADMDGSHISQLTVPSGGEFEYEFPLLRDGLYWYHPHVRTFDQVERGLHGAILVRDPELEALLELDRVEEHVLVFDDVLLDANHEIVPAFDPTDPLERVLYQLNGREGNHLLVNGKVAGVRSLVIENGVLQRWHVLNAANTTFCRLDLAADALVPMLQIGTDSGLLPWPVVRPPVIPLIPPNPTLTAADRLRTQSVWQGFSGTSSTSPRGRPGERLSIVEAAEGPDHSVPQSDLQGIFLVPGERMDVLFLPLADDGDRLRIFQTDWFRGRHGAEYDTTGTIILPDDPLDGRLPPQHYLDLFVSGPRNYPPFPTVPARLRPLDGLGLPSAQEAVGTLPVTLGHGNPTPAGEVTMFAQARFTQVGGTTTMTPLPTAAIDSFEAHDAEMGEVWIWEITNLSHGDHPFHTHGFFFRPYEVQFMDQLVPENNRTVPIDLPFLKDTLRIPARPNLKGSSKSIVRAVVRFDDRGREERAFAAGELPTFAPDGSWTSGGWLFHCHVLEHAALGMLSFYEVHDPGAPFRPVGKHLGGTRGRPSLTAAQELVPGSPIRLNLVDALPEVDVVLIAGLRAARLSVAGGTLVPAPEAVFRTRTDAQGRASWALEGWEGIPSGASFWLQAGFRDPGAPRGLALSNGLEGRVP